MYEAGMRRRSSWWRKAVHHWHLISIIHLVRENCFQNRIQLTLLRFGEAVSIRLSTTAAKTGQADQSWHSHRSERQCDPRRLALPLKPLTIPVSLSRRVWIGCLARPPSIANVWQPVE